MFVTCKENLRNEFTSNKKYKVISETRNTYVLYNDNNSIMSIKKDKFKKVGWLKSLFLNLIY